MSDTAASWSAAADYPPVVTLFEAFGAGATSIGKKIAEKLGVPFRAQAFASAAIAGEDTSELENREILSEVLSVLGGAYGGHEGRDIVTTQREKSDLVTRNNQTVQGYANEGGVIVGRNGAVILADRPNTLHVLLTGEVEDRVARAAAELGISESEAAQRRPREEDVRRQMSKTLYGWDPMDAEHYDMLINTSRVPEDVAVTAIVDALRQRNA